MKHFQHVCSWTCSLWILPFRDMSSSCSTSLCHITASLACVNRLRERYIIAIVCMVLVGAHRKPIEDSRSLAWSGKFQGNAELRHLFACLEVISFNVCLSAVLFGDFTAQDVQGTFQAVGNNVMFLGEHKDCSVCAPSVLKAQCSLEPASQGCAVHLSGPPAVESSIAVEDAIENRGLHLVFVSRLLKGVLDAKAPLSCGWAPKQFRTRPLRAPTCAWMRDRVSQSHSLSHRGSRDRKAFNRLRGPKLCFTPPPKNLVFAGLESLGGGKLLGVSQRPLTLILLQSIAIHKGGVSRYKLVVYILPSAKRRAYFCKSIAIEMGGVSRYFSKVLGSGVDVTILKLCRALLSSPWSLLISHPSLTPS